MKKTKTYKEWAEEAFNAYISAYKELEKGTSPIKDKYEIFRHAPILASIKRKLNGTDRGIEMLSVVNDIEHDFSIDKEAKQNYLFHFVLAYIHCHVYAGLLEEMEADKIMHYINENHQLF